MNTSPRRFRRGDTSPERPGLVFWGKQRGTDRWLTPEKFEHYRLRKNELAVKASKTPAGRIKKYLFDKAYSKTPKRKAKIAEFQRRKRHIYSPRQKVWRTNYKKMRRATDPQFRLKENLGTRIRLGFRRQCVRKQTKCIDLLGCSFEFFKGWIAEQFEPGMSFDNYAFSTWHIDHIVPIGLFDLSDPVAQKMAFNWRNCRPAWGKPNLSKNVRLDMALVEKYHLQEWLQHTKIVPLEITQAA